MTDRELLEDTNKRIKRIERHEMIQIAVVVLAFAGILTAHQLIKKIKK